MYRKLKNLLGITDTDKDDSLKTQIEIATSEFLAYTNRKEVPVNADDCIIALAAMNIRRGENAGEKSRSEGAISVTWRDDYPPEIKHRLNAFRLLKAAIL